LKEKKVRKAIIPAGGWGTRFLPATKAQPKEMLPIIDKPAIQYIVEEAINSGIEDIIIITGSGKQAIENHFDRSWELEMVLQEKGNHELLDVIRKISNLVDIHYVRQKEPRGLGHAVYCARKVVGDEPFAVLLGDDLVQNEIPCLSQLLGVFEEYGGPVLAVQEVAPADVEKYGIIEPSGFIKDSSRLLQVRGLIEKPLPEDAPSRYAIIGRYILTPEIFEILEHTPPGSGGEIQLTDSLRGLVELQPIYAYLFEGVRYDVGDKLGFLEATVKLALERPELAPKFRRFLLKVAGEIAGDADAD
jgi:UTP--glucose-1-phosphate uridylyltransferase